MMLFAKYLSLFVRFRLSLYLNEFITRLLSGNSINNGVEDVNASIVY